MSGNEGPSKSDWKKSRERPRCSEDCAHLHGDQALTTDELLIDELRAEVAALKTRQTAILADAFRVAHAERAEEREACARVADEWVKDPGPNDQEAGVCRDVAKAIRARGAN